MGLVCPECKALSGLQIESSLEIGPDSRSDEISLQLIKCRDCGLIGAAVYEESRRGGGDESVDHYGFKLNILESNRLKKLLQACPHPKKSKCSCPSHQLLNSRNDSGRWQGLNEIDLGAQFPIVYVR